MLEQDLAAADQEFWTSVLRFRPGLPESQADLADQETNSDR